uniref:Uncharacterized protein n=1 Tax=Oryza meridionalis TaxID=40149 RepID=A0A0E0FAH8_9ORYZ
MARPPDLVSKEEIHETNRVGLYIEKSLSTNLNTNLHHIVIPRLMWPCGPSA